MTDSKKQILRTALKLFLKSSYNVFISEASKKIPDFLVIHNAQRKKEIWAWSEIIETAKRSKEIKTTISNEELAFMFLNMSDGRSMNRGISQTEDSQALNEVKRDWDNFYSLLTNKKK